LTSVVWREVVPAVLVLDVVVNNVLCSWCLGTTSGMSACAGPAASAASAPFCAALECSPCRPRRGSAGVATRPSPNPRQRGAETCRADRTLCHRACGGRRTWPVLGSRCSDCGRPWCRRLCARLVIRGTSRGLGVRSTTTPFADRRRLYCPRWRCPLTVPSHVTNRPCPRQTCMSASCPTAWSSS